MFNRDAKPTKHPAMWATYQETGAEASEGIRRREREGSPRMPACQGDLSLHIQNAAGEAIQMRKMPLYGGVRRAMIHL
jgi:hypothetical protein